MAATGEMHLCSRDGCPPRNVAGNRILCFICAKQYYGKCFGIEDCFYETLAPRSPFTDDANVQFICPSCLKKPKDGALVPLAIENDLSAIKTTLSTITDSQRDFNQKLAKFNKDAVYMSHKMNDLFTLDTSTNEVCHKIDVKLNMEHRKPLFSDVIKSNESFSPPIARAFKRTRTEIRSELLLGSDNVSNHSIHARPKPKSGALDAVIGPSVPQIAFKSTNMINRRFDRSLWASRFHPETTVNQVLEYLIDKTGCNGEQLNCRKLVKKDADLSSMQFVSFKIDANQDLFELIDDPQIWPKYIMVREFTVENKGVQTRTARLPEVAVGNGPMDIDLTLDNDNEPVIQQSNEDTTSRAESTQA